jgi:iron(III) transport system permease protein
MVGPALATMDRSQIEAGRTLGASPLRVFFLVTLPQLMPALRGAALLTFMSSGASFSAPHFFGQDFPVLSELIYTERSQFHNGTALTLTVVLACVSLLGVLMFRSKRLSGATASKGTPVPLRNQGGRLLATILAWGCILLLLTPHLVIIWLSFVSYPDWYSEIIPTTLTLSNYTNLFSNPVVFAPIRNSLWMSGAATVGTVLVAVPAAYLIGRKRRGGAWINFLVMIPWALPGTVVAMQMIFAFNDPWVPTSAAIALLPLAYFVRSVPLLTRMTTAVIEPFDATLIEAARTLGASRTYCFIHIILPLIAPAVVAGMALIFATSLGEFPASILLYRPGNIPISVQINSEFRSSISVAFAYSVLLMLLVAGTFILSKRLSARVM